MEETKEICDVCEKEKEATHNNILDKYLCEECWDDYGEACYNGLA
ncbi:MULTISPECIES: hypothetical protein [Salipaludibacillus]|jgi:hypothetical protein|nr:MULTISPECIES: hypothetical protein [Salipaludibacillus]